MPRTQAADVHFVVPVTLPDGATQRVAIAGYDHIGAVRSCVLVSQTGSLAVLPGGCPRR